MSENARRIVVNFHCPALALFDRFSDAQVHANALTITIEPNEGFELTFDVKAPGDMLTLREHRLRFNYDEAYEALPEAYEALLLDILNGDQTLFVRIDEVLEAWRLYTPLLDADLPVYPYEAGTWGPQEAQRLGVPIGGVCFL
jgi:glucose-6-phosphate 1-dehydrogenase